MSPSGCAPRPPPMPPAPRPLLPPPPRPLRPLGAGESVCAYSALVGSNVGSATVFQSSSAPSSSYARRDIFGTVLLLASGESISGRANYEVCRIANYEVSRIAHCLLWNMGEHMTIEV